MNKVTGFLVALILQFYPAVVLLAQQDSVQHPVKLKRGFYEDVSSIIGDFSRLSNVLVQNGFPALNQTYGGMSFGVSARPSNKDSYFTGKIFILNTYSAYNAQTDSKGAAILNYGLHDEWHLDLVKNNKWRIGPEFGFGVSIVRLKLFERVSTPPDFAATLSPTIVTYTEKKLYSTSYFINAGIGVDRKFKIGYLDFYFGMGAGYRLSTPAAFREKYQYNIDSPSVRLSGFQYDFKLRFEIREFVPSKKKSGQYSKFQ